MTISVLVFMTTLNLIGTTLLTIKEINSGVTGFVGPNG